MPILMAVTLLTWHLQVTESTASLRGLQALAKGVVWASGTGGTWLRTKDGGAHWLTGIVPGAEQLDFRGLHFFTPDNGLLMSAGPGAKSRIYRTRDGGGHWTLAHTNLEEKGFYDAMAFWNAKQGIILGDPVDGRWTIVRTEDGGRTWQSSPGPEAYPGEGAFAASNSSLLLRGDSEVWFASGGPGGARVFHSIDRGVHWTAAKTPVRGNAAGAGIFSLSAHGNTLMAVGGIYTEPGTASNNWAYSRDGGRAWLTPSGTAPAGYRSAVDLLEKSESMARHGHQRH